MVIQWQVNICCVCFTNRKKAPNGYVFILDILIYLSVHYNVIHYPACYSLNAVCYSGTPVKLIMEEKSGLADKSTGLKRTLIEHMFTRTAFEYVHKMHFE